MTEQEKQMKEIIKNVKYAPFNKEEPTYTVGVQMEDFVFDLITKELSNAGYGDTKQAVREALTKTLQYLYDQRDFVDQDRYPVVEASYIMKVANENGIILKD